MIYKTNRFKVEMFPPNLQKNIKELERQISLLETECEHMESDKKETPPTGKTASKSLIRELPNQPFITGPCISASSYSSRTLKFPPTAPRVYSVSCSHLKTTHEKFLRVNEYPQKCLADSRNNRLIVFPDSNPPEEPEEVREETESPLEKRDVEEQKPNIEREIHKTCKRLMGSIKEMHEPNNDNFPQVVLDNSSSKTNSWTETAREQNPNKRQEESRTQTESKVIEPNTSEPKLYSDEEFGKEGRLLANNWPEEYMITPRISSKRRPRSSRTKRNSANEVLVNGAKALFEKETQCTLWNEENGKEVLFPGLNETLKTLHLLMGELKTKLSREKPEEVLKDMQKTLLKIQNMHPNNTRPQLPICEEPGVFQGEQRIVDVKNTLLSLKKFCQEISEEKSALTQELAVKNRTLSYFKSKEKEYLSLISSLKFNLEKMKEEAEEGAHAKNELKVIRVKLQEETKVIEALKKSHGKMQELIQNYVLENDKLRAQVKITKLESEKFNVLLAGKDAEINKYKREIESFQKQITEQLSLLRSKAAENEVEQTIGTINKQRKIFQPEVDSIADQEKEDLEETESQNNAKNHSKNTEWEIHSEYSHDCTQKPEDKGKDVGNTSNDSEVETSNKRNFGLERVLSSSKNLRSSINELLQDIRRESSEMYWMSPTNSCITTSRSGVISTSSEDLLETKLKI